VFRLARVKVCLLWIYFSWWSVS